MSARRTTFVQVFVAACSGSATLSGSIALPIVHVDAAMDAEAAICRLNEREHGSGVCEPDLFQPIRFDRGWADWRLFDYAPGPLRKGMGARPDGVRAVEGRLLVSLPAEVPIAEFREELQAALRHLRLHDRQRWHRQRRGELADHVLFTDRDSVPTYVVIDTNVFLHFRGFDELSWAEVTGCSDVVLVILKTVLAELDQKKRESRYQARARSLLRRIETIIESGPPRTRAGTLLHLEHGVGLKGVLEEHGLHVEEKDDQILASMLKLISEGHEVLFVSDDTSARLRARALGLRSMAMPERYEEPVPDEGDRERQRLREEVAALKRAVPKLSVKFVGGATPSRLSVTLAKFRPASGSRYLLPAPLRLEDLPMEYRLGQYRKPTQRQVDQYNETLAKALPAHKEYLRALRAFESFPTRSVRVDLAVTNDGQAAADDVRVLLTMPEGLTGLEEDDLPTEPSPPSALPELPGNVFRDLQGMTARSVLESMKSELQLGRAFSLDLPKYLGGEPDLVAGDDGTLMFKVKSVLNHDRCELPTFFLQWAHGATPKSTTMACSIRARNLPDPVECILHIVVDHAERA